MRSSARRLQLRKSPPRLWTLPKYVHGHALQEYQGDLTDDACAVIRNHIIEKFGFDPGADKTRDALNSLCLDKPHHPIRDYLDNLPWDGIPRLDGWLSNYIGVPNTPLNNAIGRAMLIAAVRRVRDPGCKFDNIVVFEGQQGTGKSTALAILAGAENFSDSDILMLDAKAQMEALEGVWLYEICELQGLTRAETDRVKAFASRQIDRGRPAYGRFREDRPRQCIFVGTTNDDKYLRDPTGNRRWWPVKTGEIKLDALRADRDQLWAEAAYWEEKGEPIVLAEELWADAGREQDARVEDDPWSEILRDVEGRKHLVVQSGGVNRIRTSDLLENVLNIAPERQQNFHSKRLGAVMRQLGWQGPQLLRFGNRSARGYERPVEPDTG